MAENPHDKPGSIRPPRVRIAYDAEIGGRVEKKELPLVVGILADLAGNPVVPSSGMRDCRFVEIDCDNFDEIFSSIAPRLTIRVANLLANDDSMLNVELNFRTFADFAPISIVRQVTALHLLHETRPKLRNLWTRLDNCDLNGILSEIADNREKLESMDRDPLEQARVRAMLSEFIVRLPDNSTTIYGDVMETIKHRIALIDDLIKVQLDAILHHPDVQKLEASWRGLHDLVMNAETGAHLKLKLLAVSRQDLQDDLEKAVHFDQSILFEMICKKEYGAFGGHPFGVLVGDFEFDHHPRDIALLKKLSAIAAAAHAPFIAAASPRLFDMNSFAELAAPRDLTRIFERAERSEWRSFQADEDRRYVALVMPHILMRLPYGSGGASVEGVDYVETVDDHEKYLWGNAAYALARRIVRAFSLYGWCAAIRGVKGGGAVEGLPIHAFVTPNGGIGLKCPTEIAITERREKELGDLGFVALRHEKNSDMAVFFGGRTANAAMLPYMMTTSRFAHYVKAIARDKIGAFPSCDSAKRYLNDWIGHYVLLSDVASKEIKAQYPLSEAHIDVFNIPGKPGAYRAVIVLRPHFQLEEPSAPIRLVADLPPSASF